MTIDETSEQFALHQAWFRKHPELLWGSRYASRAELAREQAVRRAAPFQEPHPHIEYDAWVDHVTDNVLMKVYSAKRENGRTIAAWGLGCCIVRKLVDGPCDVLASIIDKNWEDLTQAIDNLMAGITPTTDRNDILGLAQLKTAG